MKRLVLLAMVLLVVSGAFAASTLYVNCPGKSPQYTHIQNAVNAAGSGATIIVCSGIYHENVSVLSSQTNLTIEANAGAPPNSYHQTVVPVYLGSASLPTLPSSVLAFGGSLVRLVSWSTRAPVELHYRITIFTITG